MTYVTFDPENGDLALELPAAFRRFRGELSLRLAEKFLQEQFDENTLVAMNQFVETWLRGQAGKK